MAAPISNPDGNVFVYSMDQGAARRQLHCSLGVLVVLGLAILATAVAVHPEPPARYTAWTMHDADPARSASVPENRG